MPEEPTATEDPPSSGPSSSGPPDAPADPATPPADGSVVPGDPAAAEVVDPPSVEDGPREAVTHPARLIRIASMVKNMLEEVRQAPLDEAARLRLREIHERSVAALREMLSPDLERELEEVMLPFTSPTPTEPELRIAQAQLVGWLEGLFHGIQATLFTQQAAAQAQLDQMRARRGLPPGPGPQERTVGYL